GQQAHVVRLRPESQVLERIRDLVRPHREPGERIGTERVADCYIRRVAPTRDQHTPDPGNVVARIKDWPAPSEIGLEPGGEIHRTIGRRNTDIAEVPRAVASGYVHAAAEGDR